MPLDFTPGQFARRAEFYHQLGALTGAGLTIIRGLETLERNPPSRSYRQPIRRVLDQLARGATFTEALQSTGGWVPGFDIGLLHAGEQSGRLEACFRLLADYYRDRAQLARQIIGDLAYPVALFHFAIFIFPFAQLFTSGNWTRYLIQKF
jgi:type IV pilus assembly protein PilC